MDECLHTWLRLCFWCYMNTPLPSHSIFICQALEFVKSVMLKQHLFADASSFDIRQSNAVTFKIWSVQKCPDTLCIQHYISSGAYWSLWSELVSSFPLEAHYVRLCRDVPVRRHWKGDAALVSRVKMGSVFMHAEHFISFYSPSLFLCSRPGQLKQEAQSVISPISPGNLPEDPECLTVPKYKRDLVQKLKILRQELSQQQPQAGHCRIEVSREEIFEVTMILIQAANNPFGNILNTAYN